MEGRGRAAVAGTPGCDSPASRSGLAPDVTLCTTTVVTHDITVRACAGACVSATVLYGTRFRNSLTRERRPRLDHDERSTAQESKYNQQIKYNQQGQWDSTGVSVWVPTLKKLVLRYE